MMIIKIQRCPEGKINVAVVSIHLYTTNPNSNYLIRLIEICFLKRRSLSPIEFELQGRTAIRKTRQSGIKGKAGKQCLFNNATVFCCSIISTKFARKRKNYLNW